MLLRNAAPEQRLSATLHFDTRALDRSLVQSLADHWLHALRSLFLTANSGAVKAPLLALPALLDAELKIVRALNEPRADEARVPPQEFERLIHHKFLAWATAKPDARALVFEGETLSYRQLAKICAALAKRFNGSKGERLALSTQVSVFVPRSSCTHNNCLFCRQSRVASAL